MKDKPNSDGRSGQKEEATSSQVAFDGLDKVEHHREGI